MIYSNIPLAQTLTALCEQYRLKHIIISPGSRNAPLTLGFTNNPFFKCYSVVDERCAAFFAIGIAQQTGAPSVLVCTSGSALLNYYPAISEAFYSNIPLVVLSADRPKHLINIGDGQTINQIDVFKNHVVYSKSLKIDIDPESKDINKEELPIFKNLENRFEKFLGIQDGIQGYNEKKINEAIHKAISLSGPVHLNVPFSEPLYETATKLLVDPKKFEFEDIRDGIEKSKLAEMVEKWNKADKKIVLVGVLRPNSVEANFIKTLSLDESVIIFTETTSNLHDERIFSGIDKIIAPLSTSEFKDLQPTVLLTFGGMIVSKKIKAFLRNYPPREHWHIGLYKANDTFFKLTEHIKMQPNDFLTEFLPSLKRMDSAFKPDWEVIKHKRDFKHNEYLKEIKFSDLKAFEIILSSIPQQRIVHFSNSAAIRYSQLFNMDVSIEVYCNRGTSGIDGSTSTAIGCAATRKEQTILITGDLSFLYDSNALWNESIPDKFRIIVVNNGGGGIFRILPGDKHSPKFEKYFETVHNLTSEHLCKMFGFDYLSCEDEGNLKSQLQTFYKDPSRPKLLEIFTPRLDNDEILLNYFKYLK